MNALERAIKEDGHTREWYADALSIPYWKMCRLLDGSRLFEEEQARRLAGLLKQRFDDVFVPRPAKDGKRWVLRFEARATADEVGAA